MVAWLKAWQKNPSRAPSRAAFRIIAIQLAGNRFDQGVAIAILKGRPTELPDQRDPRTRPVEGQDRGAIADIIGLPLLTLPLPVAAAKIEFGPAQHIVIMRQDSQVMEADLGRNVGASSIIICHFCHAPN